MRSRQIHAAEAVQAQSNTDAVQAPCALQSDRIGEHENPVYPRKHERSVLDNIAPDSPLLPCLERIKLFAAIDADIPSTAILMPKAPQVDVKASGGSVTIQLTVPRAARSQSSAASAATDYSDDIEV